MTRRLHTFACPLSWCVGGLSEHGGDGADPSGWLHQGEICRLDGIGFGRIYREGTGRLCYYAHLELEHAGGAADLTALIASMESAARTLRVELELLESEQVR
jgi:hypothetical protein